MTLKQRKPMNRGKGFKRPTPTRIPREERVTKWPSALATPARAAIQTIAGGRDKQSKFPYVRSKRLIEAYRLIPCQYDDGGVLCGCADGTVCCNHSNWGIHGKGKTIKASDDRGASGCHTHHSKLDQGSDWSDEEKQAAWWRAHRRSVILLVAEGYWPKSIPVPDIKEFYFSGATHAKD